MFANDSGNFANGDPHFGFVGKGRKVANQGGQLRGRAALVTRTAPPR